MGSVKKTSFKISGIIILFIFILFIGNVRYLKYTLESKIVDTCESQSDIIIEDLETTINALQTTTNKIASNDKIIQLLQDNKEVNDLDLDEIEFVDNEINTFQGLLESWTFIDTINIANLQSNYLFTGGKLVREFDVKDRPWFKDEYLTGSNTSVVSEVHKDFNTGEYVISIISMIYSKEDNSVIGFAISDIFIDRLVKYINSEFSLGDLDTNVRVADGVYYSGLDGIVTKPSNDKNYYIVDEKNVIGDLKLLFKFDKDSIIYNEIFKSFINFQTIFYISFGLILSIILIRILQRTFRPISECIQKFRPLLASSNKCDLYLGGDEFGELEFMANTISKTIDERIEHLIYFDELTGLPNRKSLVKITSELINDSKEFALIFIDLDKFKKINDLFGHLIGDELLKEFSNRMNLILADRGTLTRYSGDEFIIVYTKYKDNSEIDKFYNNEVIEAFKNPLLIKNNNIVIEFSAGVSVYPKDGESLDDLIKKSDFMMYKTKKKEDRKVLEFFDDETYKNIVRIETIKSELKTAIKNNEFILNYQPIFDRNNDAKKIEALIRWKNKKLGFISPMEFITYAEEIGEIIPIGYWIIHEVCKNYNIFKINSKKPVQISINVSPLQLMEVDFVENIKKIINNYNVDCENICFEITESVVLDANTVVINNIEALYSLGIKIALDDFGTGYASFSYLKKFNLDILKIDKTFIDDARDEDYKIVENIKNIAHQLDMDVVIEGVETKEQFEILQNMECDFFQGYYFSKPLSFDEINEFLKNE